MYMSLLRLPSCTFIYFLSEGACVRACACVCAYIYILYIKFSLISDHYGSIRKILRYDDL